MNQIQLLDKKIYPFRVKLELLEYIPDKKKILIAINAEKILKADEQLTKIINKNIGYPDGIGAVWALKKKGFKVEKIPGVELWLDIIRQYSSSKSFYFIGASDEVINETINKLKTDFPEINILNYRNGYLTVGEKELLTKDLINKKPDVVFVAMGTPKQEYLMDELLKAHPALYMGLGGSFDVYCGKLNRAPKVFLKLKLEWLYRLLKEPTRIRRQIKIIKFLFLLKLNKL